MATSNQIKVIKIRQKELGLDDATYRDFLEGLTGKRSCTRLSFDEARDVIMEMAKRSTPPGHEGRGRASRKPTPHPASPPEGRGVKFAPSQRGPSDGKETINEKQQECIEAFRQYLKWDEKKMQVQAKKIVKVWWPQTRKHGVALIINLIAISADQILRNIQFLDKSKLTDWERGFLYFNKPNALAEYGRYVANKNKRGRRTMPDCSPLKLLEIFAKRPMKPVIASRAKQPSTPGSPRFPRSLAKTTEEVAE